jgi:hypothetical protein
MTKENESDLFYKGFTVSFTAISQHMPGRAKENHENLS